MGVLNVTPDSFSDGGAYANLDAALTQAEHMLRAGADMIDVGGESTRPGAQPISTQQELERVVPVIEAITQQLDVPVSVDTSTPEVMRASVQAGAELINDVRALTRPGALACAVQLDVPVCLMHMQGSPATMQAAPRYQGVVDEVKGYLQQRMQACLQAGLAQERILLDPGFGFGKTLEHNLSLLSRLDEFSNLGCPLLVGMSRKSMIGQILDKAVTERLHGSVAAALIAVIKGAHVVRVHDVAETADALRVWAALRALENS